MNNGLFLGSEHCKNNKLHRFTERPSQILAAHALTYSYIVTHCYYEYKLPSKNKYRQLGKPE